MTETREQILENRRLLRSQYQELYDSVSALLFRHDPMGINFEGNTDEYEPEVGTILPKLRSCIASEDALKLVHEEFVRWFDSSTAGPPEHYRTIAEEIWRLWQDYIAKKRQT